LIVTINNQQSLVTKSISTPLIMSYRGEVGRGRGVSNAPAWMTKGSSGGVPTSGDAISGSSGGGGGSGGGEYSSSARDRYSYGRQYDDSNYPHDQHHGHGHHPRYDRHHDYHRDRDYDDRRRGRYPPSSTSSSSRRRPQSNRSGIFFNSYEEERAWVEERRRRRHARKSLFDVLPTQEQLALEELQKAALASSGPNPSVFLKPEEMKIKQHGLSSNNILMEENGNDSASKSRNMQPQQTRHARRLYVGNLPTNLKDKDVHHFFKGVIHKALGEDEHSSEDPILSVYINDERRFAFIEFKSADICTACLGLDGIDVCQSGKVKVKRPNDYNPALATSVNQDVIKKFDLSKLGIISPTVPDSPNKIFIGGLPYHLSESEVLELLKAFGAVKAFHLVKPDATSTTSKGYCFVEYVDAGVGDIAVMGLNGMDMGNGKQLSAKIATKSSSNQSPTKTGGGVNVLDLGGVTPIVPSSTMMTGVQPIIGSTAPPIMKIVDGIDIEALVDVAMGKSTLPLPNNAAATTNAVAAPNVLAAPTMLQQQPPISNPSTRNPLDIANAALAAFGNIDGSFNGIGGALPLQHQQQTNNGSGQSRILVLHNMVTNDDFVTDEDYEGLKDEVKEECEKYGSLISMNIPHPKQNYPPSALRKIFLEYANIQDAMNAERELGGRQFGPNTVEVTYFNESEYSSGKLA